MTRRNVCREHPLSLNQRRQTNVRGQHPLSLTPQRGQLRMVQVASLFNQLLDHFPKLEFDGLVREHEADKGAKGFAPWTQLVAMLFCQLARADSLREICNGLACSQGKLTHLGIGVAPNKSTLAYANKHRP